MNCPSSMMSTGGGAAESCDGTTSKHKRGGPNCAFSTLRSGTQTDTGSHVVSEEPAAVRTQGELKLNYQYINTLVFNQYVLTWRLGWGWSQRLGCQFSTVGSSI